MKKFLFLLLIICFSGGVLFGCTLFEEKEEDLPKVKSIEMVLQVEESYNTRTVRLIPDYEKRELTVMYSFADYGEDFEDIEEKIVPEIIESEAVIGLDNFDKFERVVDIYYNENSYNESEETFGAQLIMTIEEMPGNKEELRVRDEFNEENIKFISDFYEELLKFFEEDMY